MMTPVIKERLAYRYKQNIEKHLIKLKAKDMQWQAAKGSGEVIHLTRNPFSTAEEEDDMKNFVLGAFGAFSPKNTK